MKAGDDYHCPECGRDTFLKKESVMEGWTKTGEVLKCASCGAVAETLQLPGEEDSAGAGEAEIPKNKALLDLLGGDDRKVQANPFEGEATPFCRDCRYRVVNAFRMRCMKFEKDVNPMDDCPAFEKR